MNVKILRKCVIFFIFICSCVLGARVHKKDLDKKILELTNKVALQECNLNDLKKLNDYYCNNMSLALNYVGQSYSLQSSFYHIPGTFSAITKKSFIPSLERGVSGPLANEPFKSLYKKNNFNNLPLSPGYIIPPIIHQIWVGPHSKERFEKSRKTFLEKHPGWLYKLWTDEDVAKLTLVNENSYKRAPNYAFRADILRYEILYLFGGVYIDIDCQCLQPLDILNCHYEFYAGMIDHDLMANAVIASVPGHPILKHCIETIKEDSNGYPYLDSTGPPHFTKSFKAVAPLCSGPVIALPIDYFYPLVKNTLLEDFEGVVELETVDSLPETFIIHGSAATWTR